MSTCQVILTKPPHRQQGAALLVLLTIVVLAASYALLKRLNKEQPDILRASDTAAVLAEARTALVGYALSSTTRPGELPCPDYGNGPQGLDGISDICNENIAYVTIGRLPWKTLGLRDLRDASGESLWYAPAIELDNNSAKINSETATSLRVVTNNAEQIAAVVIAPGKVTSTQTRPQNLASQITPDRYLEASNATADINISVVAPNATTEFTDQVLVITRDELIQAVERRVLGELKTYLKTYYNDNNYYPYPAALNTTSCDSTPPDPLQGHVPMTINASCVSLAEWARPLPGWFNAEGWNLIVWYAMATACTHVTPGCTGTGFVEVLNTPGTTNDKQAVVIAAGSVRTGQDRSPADNLDDLLDSSVNSDYANQVFEKLPVNSLSNDQILIVTP